MPTENKSIDEIIKEYSDVIHSNAILREVPLKDKYFEVNTSGNGSQFAFCRDGERIYVLSHPLKGRGWYFLTAFEGLLISAINHCFSNKTRSIFGYGIDFKCI